MTRLVAMIVTGLSLNAASAPAQSPAGQWTGRMGLSAEQQVPVFMDIKVSGANVSGRVTGPNLTPGNIRKGSFDAKTGAVAFEVHVEDGVTVVSFDGKITGDSISGRVGSAGQAGVFSLGRGTVPRLIPPATAADTLGTAIKAGFAQVSDWITRSAQLVPADKYTYKPVGTVRSFGQMLAHIVDGYAYYCGRGAGKAVQWTDATEKGATDKAALATKLKQAADACTASYTNPKQLPPLMENIAHSNLHYGNIVTYMRMMGLVPPSS